MSSALVALAASTVAAVVFPASTAVAASVPYTDPKASGTITLCDASMRAVTSGSTTTIPFVAQAVGSASAPAPYNANHPQAFIMYYVPKKNVDPTGWDGVLMTAATAYFGPKPIAKTTPLDLDIGEFMKALPPQWDGYIQLRLYYSAEGTGTSAQYAATDIKIAGSTWTVVRGVGTSSCDAGKAVSAEEGVPNFSASVAAVQASRSAAAKAQGSTPPSNSASMSSDPSVTPSPTEGASNGDPATSSSDPALAIDTHSTGSSSPLPWILVAVTVLVGVAVAIVARSRRGNVSAPRHASDS